MYLGLSAFPSSGRIGRAALLSTQPAWRQGQRRSFWSPKPTLEEGKPDNAPTHCFSLSSSLSRQRLKNVTVIFVNYVRCQNHQTIFYLFQWVSLYWHFFSILETSVGWFSEGFYLEGKITDKHEQAFNYKILIVGLHSNICSVNC